MTCPCTPQTRNYNWTCAPCMVRKIKHLRSRDARLSKQLQLATFERMGPALAERVKQILASEAK